MRSAKVSIVYLLLFAFGLRSGDILPLFPDVPPALHLLPDSSLMNWRCWTRIPGENQPKAVGSQRPLSLLKEIEIIVCWGFFLLEKEKQAGPS